MIRAVRVAAFLLRCFWGRFRVLSDIYRIANFRLVVVCMFEQGCFLFLLPERFLLSE